MKLCLKAMAVVLVACLTASCSSEPQNITDTNVVLSNQENSSQQRIVELPREFSPDKLQNALTEYINYRLWFYPGSSGPAKYDFEALIGKEISADIRWYTNQSGEKSVYVSTDVGAWLAKMVEVNGFIYCDGLVDAEDHSLYPQGDYRVVGKFTCKIEAPRKPNYGESPRKNKIIEAIEKEARRTYADFESGTESDLWRNTKAYIVDFYEYEEAVEVWFVRTDGYAWNCPIAIIPKDDKFETQRLKGFDIKNVDELDPLQQKQIHDAVKQMELK